MILDTMLNHGLTPWDVTPTTLLATHPPMTLCPSYCFFKLSRNVLFDILACPFPCGHLKEK